jgi:hypothetical protein
MTQFIIPLQKFTRCPLAFPKMILEKNEILGRLTVGQGIN